MTAPIPRRDSAGCDDLEDCRLIDPQVELLLDREAQGLTQHFGGTFSSKTVNACVHTSFNHLADHAQIRAHLPVLAARRAQRILEEEAAHSPQR